MPKPLKPQSQASLSDQLLELVQVANQNGLYDAADWLQERVRNIGRCTPGEIHLMARVDTLINELVLHNIPIPPYSPTPPDKSKP